MRPLKEKTGPSFALEADAIDLLRATRPHEVMPGQKQRVRARLLEQRVTRRGPLFRPVVVIAIVLVAAAASAAVGRHWIERTVRTLVASPAHPKLASSELPARGARAARPAFDQDGVATVEEISSVSESPSVEALPTTGDGPVVREHAAIAKRSTVAMHWAIAKHSPVARRTAGARRGSAPRNLAAAHGHDPATFPAAAARPLTENALAPVDPSRENHSRGTSQSDQTGLVYDAMRALRQEGRPSRAARLLVEYLRGYPTGSLAEEALALSVEAAATRGDARGEELARQYFARYPSGHFQAAVETARARLSQ